MVNIMLTFLAILFIVFGSLGAITQIVAMLGHVIANRSFQINNLLNMILITIGITMLLVI